MEAKALFLGEGLSRLPLWLTQMSHVLRRAFADPSTRTFPPGAFLLFVAGAAAMVWRQPEKRLVGAGLLIPLIVLSCVFIGSGSETALWHRHRYQMRYFPLMLLLAVALWDRMNRAGAWRRRAAMGMAAAYGAASVFLLPFWMDTYARDTAAILQQHVAVAETIRDTLPADAVIGVHDLGAIVYLSERRCVDLIGLVTPGQARAYRRDMASVWRTVRALPPGERPDYLAVYDNWWAFGKGDLLFERTVTVSDILGHATLKVYAVNPGDDAVEIGPGRGVFPEGFMAPAR